MMGVHRHLCMYVLGKSVCIDTDRQRETERGETK